MKDLKTKLQDRLRTKLAQADISVNALEKQAGLKRSAVQNILHGRSKKPSAEILAAICKVLGCSIQDLLEQPSVKVLPTDSLDPLSVSNKTELEPLNIELYAKALSAAQKSFKAKNIQPTKQTTLKFVEEIYQYSLNAHKTEIDSHFCEWLISKMLTND